MRAISHGTSGKIALVNKASRRGTWHEKGEPVRALFSEYKCCILIGENDRSYIIRTLRVERFLKSIHRKEIEFTYIHTYSISLR